MNEHLTFATWIGHMLRPFWLQSVWLACIALITSVLASVADPIVIKVLIDSLVRHNQTRFLAIVGIAGMLYLLTRWLGAYFENQIQDVTAKLNERLLLSALDGFFHSPYAALSRNDSGYFVARIADESMQLAGSVAVLTQLLQSCVFALAATTVCIWLSWRSSVLLLLGVPILRLAAKRYSGRIQAYALDKTESEAQLKQVIGTAVSSFRTARVFGLESVVRKKVQDVLAPYLTASRQSVHVSATYRAFSGFLLSTSELSILVATGFAVLRGTLTLGGLFGFISAFGKVIGSVEGVASIVPVLATLDSRHKRFNEFTGVGTVPVSRGEQSPARLFLAGATVSHDETVVLEDCHFTLMAPERILLRGPNGSGKTTLAHVLCGFLPVLAGEVDLPPLRQISALLTPCTFIPGTLRDNLGTQLEQPMHRARFESLRKELHLRVDLDDDPSRLSEGEKRKFQIIMVLMKDASFYIFDEPLANLDAASCPVVMDAILQHTQGKGLLVIMHGSETYDSAFTRVIDIHRLRATPPVQAQDDREVHLVQD